MTLLLKFVAEYSRLIIGILALSAICNCDKDFNLTFHNESKTWSEVKDFCFVNGGILEADETVIRNHKKEQVKIWLGAYSLITPWAGGFGAIAGTTLLAIVVGLMIFVFRRSEVKVEGSNQHDNMNDEGDDQYTTGPSDVYDHLNEKKNKKMKTENSHAIYDHSIGDNAESDYDITKHVVPTNPEYQEVRIGSEQGSQREKL
ncbi:uncharacterized protein LOC143054275 isoform X4 [Mytilus galloprovincialis]|uniref:uncharacterized protein LOC143054275 isoform X4 n=1 Tax=Mytilus galloprovincialis TaxID=29158 RepID=UPI003F7C0E2A